jgi:hypothetical protein
LPHLLRGIFRKHVARGGEGGPTVIEREHATEYRNNAFIAEPRPRQDVECVLTDTGCVAAIAWVPEKAGNRPWVPIEAWLPVAAPTRLRRVPSRSSPIRGGGRGRGDAGRPPSPQSAAQA